MPINITANNSEIIDLMFPVVPSPQMIEVIYSISGEVHSINVKLSEDFQGLHYK